MYYDDGSYVICTLRKYFYGYQIKEDEVDRSHSTQGRDICIIIESDILMGKERSDDIRTDGKIKLKWILRNVWTKLVLLRTGSSERVL
jgi:hypothetical protein